MHSLFANVIVLAMLAAIILSLGVGLYYLLFQKQQTVRTYKALAIRIGLSMLLFLGLIFAIFMHWVTPAPPPL